MLSSEGAAIAQGQVKAIQAGVLVDGLGGVIKNATIVVEKDRIVSVSGSPSAVPPGAARIDLSRYTVIPGLIDVHTHMTYYWDRAPGTRPWSALATANPAVTTFLAQENARRTLETGVTTVRDLGASDYTDIAMRNLINRGAMPGPRMLVSGYGLIATSLPFRPSGRPAEGGLADGVPEVLRAVRQQVAAGVDCIKMYTSTGSDQDVTGFQTFTLEEIKAAVDAAHKFGKRIAVHSYGPDAARDAVAAGADSVEHPIDLDGDTLALMARRGTFYVPTIDHNRYYIDERASFGYDEAVAARLRAFIDRNLETTRRAVKAGVRIAMGSDAVFTMFGQNTRELAWFVRAGMTPPRPWPPRRRARRRSSAWRRSWAQSPPGASRTSSRSTATRWPTSTP